VLKGPQATLGGRTASAGVINIVTRGPSSTWTGTASATVTDDNEQREQLFLAGPITHSLAFSVSAWGRHTQYLMENLRTGEHTYTEAYGSRGKLLFSPNADLDVTLSARISQERAAGSNFVYGYITPGANMFPYVNGVGLTQAQTLPGIDVSPRNVYYSTLVPNEGSIADDADVSLNADYRIGDYTLTSTTAYQHEALNNTQDLFLNAQYFWNTILGLPSGTPSPPAFYDNQTIALNTSQLSQEVKLVSPADRPFNYIVGVFFSDTRVKGTQLRTWVANPVDYTVIPETYTSDLYGRSTWKLLDRTSLITGLRFNYDVIKYTDNQTAYGTDAAGNAEGPWASAATNRSPVLVGDITLQQRFDRDSMAYFTYARGYKPKAYNTAAPLLSNTPETPVAKERIDHFELGTKGTYDDGRLVLDLALFDTIYNDFQIQSYAATGYGPTLDLRNGDASTMGAEFDGVFKATRDLHFNLDLSLIDAKFTNFANSPCYGGQTAAQGCQTQTIEGTSVSTQNVSGQTLPLAPKFKGTLAAEQRVPLADSLALYLGGDYAYRSRQQFLPDENPQSVMHAFGILNLDSRLEKQTSSGASYTLSLFVNNVLDKSYVTDMEDFWAGLWAVPESGGGYTAANAVIVQPARDAHRYFGARFSASF
jgi:iron complex outermembrane recepter protein